MKHKSQKGFIRMTGWDLIFVVLVIGFIGWASIETALWLFSFVSVEIKL